MPKPTAMRRWGSVFVKAASQGSSVGCYKVTELAHLSDAIHQAFRSQVLVEKAVQPRELEVAVYQYGDELVATRPGEICVPGRLLLAMTKYSSGSHSTTRLDVGDLSAEQVETIRTWRSRRLPSSSSGSVAGRLLPDRGWRNPAERNQYLPRYDADLHVPQDVAASWP